MLAGEAGDKAAAANLAARLEPAVDSQQVAPGRQPGRLAFEHAPEHDAVAAQQSMREMLDRGGLAQCFAAGGVAFGRAGAAGQGPAAGRLHAEHRAATARAAPVGRHQEGAQPGEAVRGDEAKRHQFAERLFDLRPQQPAALDQLVEERGALLADHRHDRLGARARLGRVRGRRQHAPQRRIAAGQEGDRRRVHRAR